MSGAIFILLKRILKSGWQSFRRQDHLSVATILVLTITISLIASLFLFQRVLGALIIEAREKAAISVYFKEESAEKEIFELERELKSFPEVAEISYISREEALEKFSERHQKDQILMESLSEVGSNPFLASLSIKTIGSEDYQNLVEFLSQNSSRDLIEKVDYHQRKSIIDKIFQITGFLQRSGLVISLLLMTISLLLTFNTIRLAISSFGEEIRIMRLVGASNWFIRGPFLLQGVFSALVALLISLPLLFASIYFVSSRAEAIFTGVKIFAYFQNDFGRIFLIQVVSALFLAVVPAFLAIRKYLEA